MQLHGLRGWRPLNGRPWLRMAVWSQVKVCGVWEQAEPMAYKVYARSVCDTVSVAAAAVCDLWHLADVISAVYEPAHIVAHQRMQHSIVVRPTAVRAISTDIICQGCLSKLCRTSDLELTATCCVKLRLFLYFQIQT